MFAEGEGGIMNREFVFTMRDVVNLFLVYVPALFGWAVIVYVLMEARRKRG